jgi:RNA polymerase primary sigma factor
MAKFRIDSIGELARQLKFTPGDTRLAQIAAAEGLLHDLDPAKAYPLDFVIYRITGYRPRNVGRDLLTGLALQHDLGLLIEQVSDSLDVASDKLAEPVLDIDDVTERFNVTSKTIQRWRRRGLSARRFVFADGKKRVGFLLSSVERFIAAHRSQIENTANISQVDDAEQQHILSRARRLAVAGRCCPSEIARRIAGRLKRSPLTILHTIRKHDQEHPQDAIFPLAASELSDHEQATIHKGIRHGLSIGELARRLRRPRSAIARALLDERIARIAARRIAFIDDPLYHQPDAQAVIDAIAADGALEEQAAREQLRIPRDVPDELQYLYRIPLLGASRERGLFLKFNFHKYQFATLRRRLDPQFARARDLQRLEHCLGNAQETKNAIVQANLRLVVSIARRHLRPGLSLMELISDGNLTLMRAVEGFDIHRGHRFSTYATLALMKGFARSVPQMLSQNHRAAGMDEEMLEQLPDRSGPSATERALERADLRQSLGRLDECERHVLSAHFGLDADDPPATYEQVGQRLGLSKQRVRQIERSALAKLRAALASGD